jgi:hypothetical protein
MDFGPLGWAQSIHFDSNDGSNESEERKEVQVDYKRKGDKLIISQKELHEYLEGKLHDLTNSISNIITALIIVSIMVVIQTFKASDVYLYALILLPLIARG